jgi:hypothetical protein
VKNIREAAEDTEGTFEESLADALVLNKEHMVYYAKSLQPGCPLCFICAAYNLPSVKSHAVAAEAFEVILHLEEFGFIVRALTSDAAASNTAFLRDKCDVKASDLIPVEHLQKFELDGNFNVGFKNPLTDDVVVFVISDPPHVIKRVGSALENRELIFDNHMMTMDMLYDVFVAINTAQGSTTLSATLKLTVGHFFGNNFSKMNVRRSAQVLSGTMVRLIDQVCDEPALYDLPRIPLGTDRTAFFSRIRQLCLHMNRFFDLCNSKDPKNPFVQITNKNGIRYAEEFLEILGWFSKWERWVLELPGNQKDRFIPKETFNSMKYVCYGFAAMIFEIAKKENRRLSLCRVGQDVNEHHFGNARASVRSHSNPNQREAMAAISTSSLVRLQRISKGNCSELRDKQTEIDVKTALSLKRRKFKK